MICNTESSLALQIAAWLRAQNRIGGPRFLPTLLHRVLCTMPGFLQEMMLAQMSRSPHKTETLNYLLKRFRYKAEMLLTREELLELIAQVHTRVYDERGEPLCA